MLINLFRIDYLVFSFADLRGESMKVLKAINNNIVSACDINGQELVVVGKGIGFKAEEGTEIKKELIEKVFRMDNQQETDRLKALFSSLPLEYIQISDNIISYAYKILNKRLNNNIYITLTDHINFAIYRHKQGMMFKNVLLTEVKRFYNKEYLIGEYSLNLIEEKLGIHFPMDEAASIALHILNAEYDTSISEAVSATNLIQEILNIIKDSFDNELCEDTIHYERFITHLKFFAQRIFKNETLDTDDHELNEILTNLYPRQIECASKIADFVNKEYDFNVGDEEISYLALHIRKILTAV